MHHRRPRTGRSSLRADASTPAGLLIVCGTATDGCRGWVGSHREDALGMGHLIDKWEDPAHVGVELHHGFVWLDHGGTYDRRGHDATSPWLPGRTNV